MNLLPGLVGKDFGPCLVVTVCLTYTVMGVGSFENDVVEPFVTIHIDPDASICMETFSIYVTSEYIVYKSHSLCTGNVSIGVK